MTHPDVELVATGYDVLYEGISRSPTFERIWRAHSCGEDYPWDFGHISFLTLAEMTRLAQSLRLERDGALVDLACGMGGPGLWVARQADAHLTGVDVAAVALREAARRAQSLGMEGHAAFALGSFAETGLDPSSFDGAMTIDALQYAPDKHAACREVARVLRPGGRFGFTAFELGPAKVDGLPVWGTDPVDDYRVPLEAAGFRIETYEETPGWQQRLTDAYSAVLAEADTLRSELGEAAVGALESEISVTLALEPYPRRVFCVAAAR